MSKELQLGVKNYSIQLYIISSLHVNYLLQMMGDDIIEIEKMRGILYIKKLRLLKF